MSCGWIFAFVEKYSNSNFVKGVYVFKKEFEKLSTKVFIHFKFNFEKKNR